MRKHIIKKFNYKYIHCFVQHSRTSEPPEITGMIYVCIFLHLCSRLYLQFEEVTFNHTSTALSLSIMDGLCYQEWLTILALRILTSSFKYSVKQFLKYSINSSFIRRQMHWKRQAHYPRTSQSTPQAHL